MEKFLKVWVQEFSFSTIGEGLFPKCRPPVWLGMPIGYQVLTRTGVKYLPKWQPQFPFVYGDRINSGPKAGFRNRLRLRK